MRWRWWRPESAESRDEAAERELREEIDAHLAIEADRLMAQRGLSDATAKGAARRAFGNVGAVRERAYETHRTAWLDRWRQHVRLGLRAMRRRPGFAAAAIVTLGAGIGFNTALFTVFYALTARAFPVRDADRVVNVYQEFQGDYTRNVHGSSAMVSYPEFLAYRATIDSMRGRGGAIASASVYAEEDFAFSAARPAAMHGQYVSCEYFATLAVRMAFGRPFTTDECAAHGSPAVTVLSYAAWRRELGGDSAVVGSTVRINQTPFTVIGVAEPGFGGVMMQPADVWVPVTMQMAIDHRASTDSLLISDWSWLMMAARLAPGASAAAVRAELSGAAAARDRLYSGRTTKLVVTPGALFNFPEVRRGGALGAALLVVLGGIVVVMVCANIMNLLLARGLARRREIGIRLAIGASRGRLIEQLLIESALLSMFGGGLGLALAFALPPLATRLIPIPVQLDVTPDLRVLAFTLVVALLTVVAFGLVPALQATQVDLVSAFKGGMRLSRGEIRPSRLRGAIVGVQVAGGTLLLIVAALFVRAAVRGATIDPGYTTRDVVAFSLNVTELGYTGDRSRVVYDALRDRLATAPGVRAVALASPLPLLGRRSESIQATDAAGQSVTVNDVANVSASGTYLETMRIPLLAGRSFTDAEAASTVGGELPVVVNQALATQLWGAGSALGQRLRMNGQPLVVVGVARNTRHVSLASDSGPFMYLPATPAHTQELAIVVRTDGTLGEIERMMPGAAQALDREIVVSSQRMSERMALELTPARVASAIAGAMGLLTTLLSLIGVYGVVSYTVSQRTRDIAVRLALGATHRGVVRAVMRQGVRPVVIGLAAGGLLALGASLVLRSVLLGVSPYDPAAYGIASLVLIAATGAALYVPARRAAGVDPAAVLREE